MNVTSNGVQIRIPAVANLMVDSKDRPNAVSSSPCKRQDSRKDVLNDGEPWYGRCPCF